MNDMAKKNVEDIYPLSPLQQGLFFQHLLDTDRRFYWNQLRLYLKGELDVPAFRAAWQRAVDRHAVFRTRIVQDRDGRTFQVVNRTADLPWHYEDLSDVAEKEREVRVSKYEGLEAPALEQPPLTRIALFKLAPGEHLAVWGYQHIILDGWSEAIIWGEIWKAYGQQRAGAVVPLADPVPYSAYIAWLNGRDKMAAKRFWADYLADFAPTALVAPLTRPDGVYASYSFDMAVETSSRITTFARTHRLTLTTLLQGTWAIVLGAERGTSDVVFGSAINDRPVDLNESEKIAGLVMASVPLRFCTDSSVPVVDWLFRAQSLANQMSANSGLTLGEIKAAAKVSAGEVLFDTLCALDADLENDPLQGQRGEIEVTDVERRGITEFPMSVTFLPGESIRQNFTVDRSIFDSEWCARAFSKFAAVLDYVCAGPDAPVAEISRLAAGMIRQADDVLSLGVMAGDPPAAESRPHGWPANLQGLDYWRSKLGGALPALEFPRFRPRPPEQQPGRHSAGIRFDEDLGDRLRQFARREKVDLSCVLLTGFAAVLLRYCRQNEVVVGTLLRSENCETSTEDSTVPDINTVALWLQPGRDWSFARFVHHVDATKSEAQEHNDTPLEDLVASLALSKDGSRAPIFQALAAYSAYRNIGTVTASVQASLERTDLNCWFDESGDTIDIEFEYASALFDSTAIENFASHLRNYLDTAMLQVEDNWFRIPMLDANDVAEQLARRGPDEKSLPDQPVTNLVWRAAEKHAEQTAVTSADVAISYGELHQRCSAIAGRLIALGVAPGSIVGLAVSRTEKLPLAMLAILDAGAAFLPLDAEQPVERLEFVLQNSGAELIVTDRLTRSDLPRYTGQVVHLDALEEPGKGQPEPPGSSTDRGLAYVMYTSGSTGTPKGVAVGHRELVNLLTGFRRPLGVSSDDVWAAITTTSFDISVLELLLPLTVGARVHVVGESVVIDGRKLAAELEACDATIMQGTPASWRLLFDSGWSGDPALKVLCGGESLPLDLAQTLTSSCGTVWNVYGPTETTVWSTMATLAREAQRISIGLPIQNTCVYIVDELDALVPDGVEGEILIAGDGVAQGYLNDSELTRNRFGPDPFDARQRVYRTGDVGRWLPNGELEHRGRSDSQLKLRGFRIEAGDVENNLATAHGVSRVAVTIRSGPGGDPRLVAFVVLDEKTHLDAVGLRRYLRDRVPEYMVPQHFIELNELPLTHNLKVDYASLPQLENYGASPKQDGLPATPSERLLARVWCDLIGIKQVSTRDNFFEVGGHSMLTIRAIATILKETGVELQPQFFILEDLATIATRIGATTKDDAAIALQPTRTERAKNILGKLFGARD